MEKRRLSLIIPLLWCGLVQIQAQWDDLPGQYRAVKNYLNPSFAGETDAIRTAALYRCLWGNAANAPRQILLTADAPFEWFRRRHGAGVAVFTETAGELRNSLLAAQYSFRKETGKGILNIGLQAGIYTLNFDAGSRRIFGDSLQYRQGVLNVSPGGKQVFDLSAGLAWTGKSFFAGLSVMHLSQPRFHVRNDSLSAGLQSDSVLSHIPRTCYLTAGYNITLFRPLEMQPEVCVLTDLNSLRMQVSLRLEYDRRFSGGASWRLNDGYVFFAGAVVRGAELGYACGLHTGGAGQNSKGSHELYLRYNFPLDYFKPKRYSRKSIRLL
ncbi:MAG: PorP/SprF family type IX secretion system membrane protein [Proteiniphilum sp.]|jgi:type IX secretion system PorP/SprF family membrane protein|nr:PorP/SprF family type IX secretion system membrane protein [Proteiniphilum sp.]